MKHYTTIFCCLVLSAVLIFVPNTQAASVSLNIIMPSYIRLNLTNQYYPQYDSTDNPLGNKAVFTYEGDLTISVSGLSVDSYNSGLFRLKFDPSVNTPSGQFFQSINTSVSSLINTESAFVSYYNDSSTSGSMYLVLYLDNHWQDNLGTLGLAVIHLTVTVSKTITTGNTTDPESYISVNTSGSIVNNMVSAFPNAIDHGFSTVVKESIINALNDVDNPIQDLLAYIQNTNSILTDIYNHNEQWYSAIVDELLANNQWNSTITDELIALYQELSINTNATINIASYTADLRSFMQTFPTWSAQMLQLLGKLADMSASEQTEAAAIASQYDSLQQQQDDANAVVKAVPRPTFSASQFDSGNMVDTTQRQNFTGLLSLIVGNGYITRIFIIVITFATAGFILFGKKK